MGRREENCRAWEKERPFLKEEKGIGFAGELEPIETRREE